MSQAAPRGPWSSDCTHWGHFQDGGPLGGSSWPAGSLHLMSHTGCHKNCATLNFRTKPPFPSSNSSSGGSQEGSSQTPLQFIPLLALWGL